jgi:deoxyribodipyrimidine photo-lyase
MWFRRDLRVDDNPALVAAVGGNERVVPLFVFDPALLRPAGGARLAFLFGCVDALRGELGGRLVVRIGDPAVVVPAVAREIGAREVWCSDDFGPYGQRRDARVARALGSTPLRRAGSPYVVAPGTLTTAAGTPFRVFSAFARPWRERILGETPLPRASLARVAAPLGSDPVPVAPAVQARLPDPGARAAWSTLRRFLRVHLDGYAVDRDRPDLDATSRLSPYLRFGCIHPRQVLERLDIDVASHHSFIAELCWREFYADVLFHRPDSARDDYRSEWRAFPWADDERADDAFDAWCAGRTGYPIVDAGMRQLLAEAWMHNRVRMITASFLVKDLHVDWRRGARWFMQHLVDGDLASNQHGWQWVAGSGTDAAPYYRVFNPITQGMRFDPDGDYVRRWVPELRDITGGAVHRPHLVSRSVDDSSLFDGQAERYPPPIVDHLAERRAALARFDAFRHSTPVPLSGRPDGRSDRAVRR